jgi:hypothetical protein
MEEKKNYFNKCINESLKPKCKYCKYSKIEKEAPLEVTEKRAPLELMKCTANPQYYYLIEPEENFFRENCNYFFPYEDAIDSMIEEAVKEGTWKKIIDGKKTLYYPNNLEKTLKEDNVIFTKNDRYTINQETIIKQNEKSNYIKLDYANININIIKCCLDLLLKLKSEILPYDFQRRKASFSHLKHKLEDESKTITDKNIDSMLRAINYLITFYNTKETHIYFPDFINEIEKNKIIEHLKPCFYYFRSIQDDFRKRNTR